MTFEEWWGKQNGDPVEIGIMQVARITWDAATKVEREACAKACESVFLAASTLDQAAMCASEIRKRSNE